MGVSNASKQETEFQRLLRKARQDGRKRKTLGRKNSTNKRIKWGF